MAVNFNQDSVFNLKPISNVEFKGAVDIGKIGRMLSEYVL